MLCYVMLCNVMLYYIILYYNLIGPPSYMRSVVDRNFVVRHMTVQTLYQFCSQSCASPVTYSQKTIHIMMLQISVPYKLCLCTLTFLC